MKPTPLAKLSKSKKEPATRLLAITPPRTGSHTMLGAENMLASIAIPEPFSLEMAGDSAGVTLMARCRDGSFVKQQLGAHYPQALIDGAPDAGIGGNEVAGVDDHRPPRQGLLARMVIGRVKRPNPHGHHHLRLG